MTKITIRNADVEISRRMTFDCYGSLRGEARKPGGWWMFHTGQLPYVFVDALRADIDEVDYVVFSYATPIAWHVNGKGWVYPDTKYSVTTSKHQGKVRMGMHSSGRPVTELT